MKKIILLFLLTFLFIIVHAQEFTKEKQALTTTSTTVGAGPVKLLDPYLSPFEYNGFQVKIQNNSRRYFSAENDKLSYSNRLLFRFTSCRRCGRRHRPGRERCSRSRSGGRP